MERENVTGYRLVISYTCTALGYKPAFIATQLECSTLDRRVPGTILARGVRVRDNCDLHFMVQ